MRSRNSLDVGGIGYFWGEFTTTGIRYGQGDSGYKGGLPLTATLSSNAFSSNTLNFGNNNTIMFQLGNGNIITNIKITLSNEKFNYGTFDAQFIQ